MELKTHYIWQGSQVIAEYNGSNGAVLTDYVYSSRRMIAKIAGGTTQYFLSDRLSTRLALDTSGNVLGRQGHLPFGEDFGESGSQEKHHFTSYERDAESGTDYAVNRQYEQSVGRFTRVDPYGGSYNIGNSQSANRFAYAENDPINRVDPLGFDYWAYQCNWFIVDVSNGDGPPQHELRWACTSTYVVTPPPHVDPPQIPRIRKQNLPQNRVKGFKKFLDSEQNKACSDKLGAAYSGIMNQMKDSVGSVDFIDTNSISQDSAWLYFPTTLFRFGLTTNKNDVSVGYVFGPDFQRIYNTIIRAITEPRNSQIGQRGIYAPGGLSNSRCQNSLEGNRNIQHELLHYITGDNDADFAKKLGIEGDVGDWFKRGCKNEGEQ